MGNPVLATLTACSWVFPACSCAGDCQLVWFAQHHLCICAVKAKCTTRAGSAALWPCLYAHFVALYSALVAFGPDICNMQGLHVLYNRLLITLLKAAQAAAGSGSRAQSQRCNTQTVQSKPKPALFPFDLREGAILAVHLGCDFLVDAVVRRAVVLRLHVRAQVLHVERPFLHGALKQSSSSSRAAHSQLCKPLGMSLPAPETGPI